MKIVLGNDHGGYNYKEELKKHLLSKDIEVIDVGCDSTSPAAWSEFGILAAKKVASKEADYGIVICRSGIGVCMAANKVKGAYCGLAYNDQISSLCKQHDGCNMLAFGADYVSIEDLIKRVDLFLDAKFEGGRHLERLNILKDFENK